MKEKDALDGGKEPKGDVYGHLDGLVFDSLERNRQVALLLLAFGLGLVANPHR